MVNEFGFDTQEETIVPVSALPVKVDTKELNQNISPIVKRANSIEISCPEECDSAIEIIRNIKVSQKSVKEKFEKPVKKAHEAHKEIKALENSFSDKLKEAEGILKEKVSRFVTKFLFTQKKDQIDSDSELKKRLDELQQKESDALLSGDNAEADKIALDIQTTFLSQVDTDGYKPPKGVSLKDSWEVIVTDPDKVPDKYKIPDLTTMQKVTTATKGKPYKGEGPIPGTRVIHKKVIAVRS